MANKRQKKKKEASSEKLDQDASAVPPSESAAPPRLTVIRGRHNPNQTYEEFKAARLEGFGGSDMADLMNEGSYGCLLKLFKERCGLMPQPEDGSDPLAFHLERGKFFEGPVAQLFVQRTGRTLLPVGTCYIKEFPFCRANPDRLIRPFDSDNGPGVLEIKVPGAFSFKKMQKEGLPSAYILQIQWQMFCAGTSWGMFAVYWPDGHELQYFRVERDEEIISRLFQKAQQEWHNLTLAIKRIEEDEALGMGPYAPSKHSEDHPACQRCPSFFACHGVELKDGITIEVPELEPAARRYVEITNQLKALEEEKSGIKDSFKDEFAKFPSDALQAGPFKIGMRNQSRESLDQEKAKQLFKSADIPVEKYMKRTEFQVMTVREMSK